MTTAAAQARYPLTQGVNPWLVTASVMLPTFMEVLDTAIASVALPYIAGSLSASNSEATWVLTSYLVANAVILPASNWFARRFGRKRFLLTCVVIFTVASFFCGAAPSLGVILLARVMQGAGGGALQPLSQSILLESFPVAQRSMSMAAYGLGATRWETIIAVILPTASRGIFGGMVLGFGRALGETMALAMLVGNSNTVSLSLFSPANTLASLLANTFPEAGPRQVGVLMYAALVLLGITLIVNVLGAFILQRASRSAAE